MNLRRLRLFLHTAAIGSVSRTAQTHGIAQPALTRQIQLLEAEIGAPVFERSPRGLRLTEVGQFLKDALELPLNEIETALGSARIFSTQVKASLTIGMPPSVSALFGSRLVSQLGRALPNVALRIVEEDSARLAANLARRIIDAAILVAITPEQRVSRTQVLVEPLMLVGAPSSASLLDAPTTVPGLASLPLILPPTGSGMRIILDRAAEAAGTRIVPAMEVDSIELTKRLVAQGDAYTILPERNFRVEATSGVLAGVAIAEPRLTQPVLWAVRPDWRQPRAVYNELERVVVEQWYEAVCTGEWPATWVLDFSILSIPFANPVRAQP